MNCRGIQEMIPLYVEGDLETDRAESVSAHLKSCVACSRLAGGFNESQEWLHSYTPPAFDSTFFDGLRNGVLAKIGDEKARPSFFQLRAAHLRWDLALAAALLLVILSGLAFYTYQRSLRAAPQQFAGGPSQPGEVPAPQEAPKPTNEDPKKTPGPAPQHRHSSLRDAVAEVIGPAQPESIVGLPPDLGFPLPTDANIDGTAVSQADPAQGETQPLVKAPPTSEVMTRIEIQTSDPTIRIIWFAPNNVEKNSGRRSTDT
ncbi:MAG TPA: zf-HC2 domain-containing protein [Blastocatellia bacterium]|jgi:hypothetical protein|nr:zf-HC2 domain-containing protein [Blastocatellia bacterium]